ncbi:MAG: alpha/beta hydrolase [Gemmatimonadota bacterium]
MTVPLQVNHQLLVALVLTACMSAPASPPPNARSPSVRGAMVAIQGQTIHLDCIGSGSPTVVLESGVGDFALVWALVQPGVAAVTRVCSYDRGGYVWSTPGQQPRSYAQINLELHEALAKAGETGPFVLVGQSYGGPLVRHYAEQFTADVVGMVLVDALHEDQRIDIGGQVVRLREMAKGRTMPAPKVSPDLALADSFPLRPAPTDTGSLEAPLDRLPPEAQQAWRWASAQPILRAAAGAEMDWSPEDLARLHAGRLHNRRTLGDLPLIVLSRSAVASDSLDAERQRLQADLVSLSSRGHLTIAPHAGHNIHLEDPELVVSAIREVVEAARGMVNGTP